ncbi:dnaJ homolog subfamily C member 17 [Neocloeon triangulifer]|uniref:dnaJ homolog subfamily C member 17 n=1 Tax=Neocloeon triangulifer TaxID=2078957 RepID=UPI00286F565D|nr:dnaJ homolog subfamily C member 17 [Neocloeon triangulifer]XP_059478470.1 dnaJ homolog subfamily C member 17 [Neocloeon triangulifer]
MPKEDSVEDLDVYAILGVPDEASVQDIKKAYRKVALQCHPDKNPDNPNAAKQFIQLAAVLKLLLDPASRNAYDALRKARLQTKLRLERQDSKRKKLREDLERREKESAQNRLDTRTEEQRLKAEIERLRKESSRQLEEEIEAMQKKLLEEIEEEAKRAASDSSIYRMKLKWKKSDTRYDENTLKEMFSKLGTLSALVVSKKGGSALLEYNDLHVARLSARSALELPGKPLEVTPIGWSIEEPKPEPVTDDVEGDDFEELVFKRMRAAQVYQSQSKEGDGTSNL